jgi:hypothetical protein
VIGQFSEDDFRKNVRAGVILSTDHYFCEGFTNWKSVADFKRRKGMSVAEQIGALLVMSWFAPMIHPIFVVFTIAVAVAAFVIATMEIGKRRTLAGILLIIGCILTPFVFIAARTSKTPTH